MDMSATFQFHVKVLNGIYSSTRGWRLGAAATTKGSSGANFHRKHSLAAMRDRQEKLKSSRNPEKLTFEALDNRKHRPKQFIVDHKKCGTHMTCQNRTKRAGKKSNNATVHVVLI
jgi:hypothetical protein